MEIKGGVGLVFTIFQIMPFEDCIKEEMKQNSFVHVGGMPVRIEEIVPDMISLQISENSLIVEEKIGEVC
jgi:hypothetical protein